MASDRLNVLHAIHDFPPRHRAGSEIYAQALGRELAQRHFVTVLSAAYDGSRPHGHLTWRLWEGLPVAEIVNNWVCQSFSDTYGPPVVGDRIGHVLRAVQPDIVHVHSLLNLSFDLPAMAAARGIPVVATLHDYSLMCPSGGQRLHRAEEHLCEDIEVDRCARCFRESAFYTQLSVARVTGWVPAQGPARALMAATRRRFPLLAGRLAAAASGVGSVPVSGTDVADRLARAREALEHVDLVVAPSASIAGHFLAFGVDERKIRISDYGIAVPDGRQRPASDILRIGYVGTLVWHKGVHVLIEAMRELKAEKCDLKVFGDPDVFPAYAGSLHRRSEGLAIRFMGPFEQGGASEAYAGIDVLVVPSLWFENSPLVIHEAFAAGVPVVAARIGGMTGLIRHGWNGLLYDPRSPAALAEALRSLVARPERLAEFASRLPPVKSIADDAREWEANYREILERQRRKAHAS
jgi:glycosyltransferase involved in cell wall biosynthesis